MYAAGSVHDRSMVKDHPELGKPHPGDLAARTGTSARMSLNSDAPTLVSPATANQPGQSITINTLLFDTIAALRATKPQRLAVGNPTFRGLPSQCHDRRGVKEQPPSQNL
jgi:hypothetical protein